MAISEQFQAIISVDDRTAGPLRRIQMNLGAIGQNTGIARLSAGIARLSAGMRGMVVNTARVGAGLAAIGIAAGVAGLTAMVNSTIEAGDNLNDLSNQLGITVEQIQELSYAAAQHGISQEQMTGGIERLTRSMRGAAAGGNKSLVELFKRMRIPLRDARGQLRQAADVMPELAEAFRNTTNPALRTAMAIELFGRGGAPLVRLLSTGSEGLEELRARFRQLDGSITGQTVPRLDAAGDAMLEVRTAITGIRNAIVLQLTPSLGPLLVEFASWIASNKEFVSLKVHEAFTALATAVREIDWAKLRTDASEFFRATQEWIDAIGGWKTVLIGLGAIIAAPFAAAALSIIASLGTVVGFLAAAGPWGLAIAAVLAGAALIITYWEPISTFFTDLWGTISGAMTRFVDGAMQQLERMRPYLEWLKGVFEFIGEALAKLPAPREARPGEVEGQQERRSRMGQRGALQNFPGVEDPGEDQSPAPQRTPWVNPRAGLPRRGGLQQRLYEPLVDPDTGGRLSAQPQSFNGSPQRGEVDVRVRFDNAPAGMRGEVESRGDAVRGASLNVGYARMGVA